MKLARTLAAGAAAALVGVASLAAADAASAAPAPSVEYVTAGQFVPETSPYPTQWFQGDVSPATGSIASGPAGLTVTGTQQLLNGDTPSSDLTLLIDSASFIADGPAAFQISLFTNPLAHGTGFTTLVPDDITPAALQTTTWHTTQAISNAAGTLNYAAGDTVDLSTFETDFPNYEILAYGVYVGAGFTTDLQSITWGSVTTRFTPAPTASVSPATITPADSADPTAGVTATFTGFIPGETITFAFGGSSFGGPTGDTGVADTNGSVTYQYVNPTALALGTYTLIAIGDVSGVDARATFDVVAPAPVLASTGVDVTTPLIAGGTLLLLGLGALALRRRAAQRG